MDAIPLCVVGYGPIGPHVVGAAKVSERVRLMGLCDLRDEVRSGLDCPRFTSLYAMLESCRPRVVYVADPFFDHQIVAEQLLTRCINVIVENGGAQSVEEFDRLTALADRCGAKYYSAFHAAQAREMRWFRENSHRHVGGFGPLVEFDAHYSDPFLLGGNAPDIVAHPGAWRDGGLGVISVLLSMIPDLKLDTSARTPDPALGVDTDSTVSCRFGDEGSGTIRTSWNGKRRREITFRYGKTRHELRFDQTCEDVAVRKDDRWSRLVGYWDGQTPLTQHYVGIFEDYAQCVKAKSDNRVFARRCLELLCC